MGCRTTGPEPIVIINPVLSAESKPQHAATTFLYLFERQNVVPAILADTAFCTISS